MLDKISIQRPQIARYQVKFSSPNFQSYIVISSMNLNEMSPSSKQTMYPPPPTPLPPTSRPRTPLGHT